MLQFLRTRQWVLTRRLVLVGIILFLVFRTYGSAILSRFSGPNPTRDISITRAEFRPELPGAKPAWIIGFRNDSKQITYDKIRLRATYMDDKGAIVETDTLVVSQELPPGDEKIIGSMDFKARGAATQGTLAVLDAEQVK